MSVASVLLQAELRFLCNFNQTQHASCFRVKDPCEVCSERSEAMERVELQRLDNKPVVDGAEEWVSSQT